MLLGRVVLGVLLCTFARGMTTTSPGMTPSMDSISSTSEPDIYSSTTPVDSISATSEPDITTPVDSISSTSGPDMSSSTTPVDISATSGPDTDSSSTTPVDSMSATSGPDSSSTTPDISATSEPDTDSSSTTPVDSISATSEPDSTTPVDSISATSGPDSSTSGPDSSTSEPDSSTSEPDSSTSEPEMSTAEMTDDTATTSTNIIPTNSTPTVSTAAPPSIIVCSSSNSCPAESICINDACQCLAGSYLLNGFCTQGQVFPGQLHLESLVFKNEMRNRSSEIFRNTAADISETLRAVLQNQPGYIRTDVLQLQPGSVLATVNNVFKESSPNTSETSVDQAIQNAIGSANTSLLSGATFEGTDLCNQTPEPCDVLTTTCSVKDGRVICSCKEGYLNTLYSNKSCRACPSGQQALEGTCQLCPFGYAGLNCNDSALLAVVVISCTLGGILLLLFLALILYCCIRRCTDDEKTLDNSPYSVDEFSHPWPVQGITPIPRATTNPNWDPNPSIEMTEGGSKHALVDKKNNSNGLSGSYDLNPEGMKTFKGKNPSRYSYLVQGHENPYFIGGEDQNN